MNPDPAETPRRLGEPRPLEAPRSPRARKRLEWGARLIAITMAACASAASATPLRAQVASARPDGSSPHGNAAIIDTLVILREDVFRDEEAKRNLLLKLLNDIHSTTRSYVVRRELLFEPGMPYDSVRIEESERNLRRLGIFRSVRVDTGRVNGKLAAIVRTRDAWSIKPRIQANIASDGTLTGSIGVTEENVAGTGNLLRVWYVRQPDRDGVVFAGSLPRFGGSRFGVGATYEDLSDRNAGTWGIGNSYRSFSDRWSLVYGGEAFSGRVFQYRTLAPGTRDTTAWRRRATINRAFLSFAPIASPREYLRLGITAEVRAEEQFLAPPPELEPIADSLFVVPDSVYGLIGAFAEYRRGHFARVSRFNGFNEEDVDLSRFAFMGLKLAPGSWGYGDTGVGARVVLGAGARSGPLLAKARLHANGLFNSAGLDSGRVVGIATAAVQPSPRHVTFLRVIGGVLENPSPGTEFDVGFEVDLRLWGPHAYVGTRTLRGTLEHRIYAWDELLSVVGLGFGAFVEYGGAWYEDQERRTGGNAGLSIFFGSPASATVKITQLSGGYRFGGGIGESGESRWVFTFGTGIIF